jgi:ligand-binding sensor domain-containing protein
VLRCLYKTLFLIGFILFYSITRSQDFIYKHYDLQDGLPNPTIHAIFQDSDGFLWIGTESGLCRYDGNRFKTYTVHDGLPGNEVLGIFQDTRGRIWLQFYKNNIAYIYKGKIYNQQNDTLLKKIVLSARVYGIAEDATGNIGICDVNSLFTVSPQNTMIKTDFTHRGKPIKVVGICAGYDGKFLIHSSRDLYRLTDTGTVFLKKFKKLGGDFGPPNVLLHKNYITNLAADSVYLKDTVVPFKMPPQGIIKFSAVSDSIFSVNLTDGAILFYLGNYQPVNILPGKKVSNVFMDSEKNIWIGTISNGLYKMSSREILNKKIANTNNDIWYISREKNNILVGNNNNEVYEIDGNNFSRWGYTQQRKIQNLKTLHCEQLEGQRYLTANSMETYITEAGIIKRRRHTIILKHVSEFDRDHLLCAMHNGVFVLRKNDLAITDTVWKRGSHAVLRVNDTILIGTTAGLFVARREKGRYFIVDSLFPEAHIVNIKKTADNLIWVCTAENGLYCIEHGKVINHFTQKTGLPSNNGRTLHAPGKAIWAGTDKGLVKILRENDRFYLKKYSTADGLPSNIINAVFVHVDSIYVGTPEGLCVFDEKKMQPSSICNLKLTGVKIGDSLVEIKNSYQLGSNQQFTIEFSGISLRSERETVYRYRIRGLDDTWRNTDLASLEFTSLPGGDYELEMIAANKFGKESEPLRIALHVMKPFHKTTWFLLLIIVLPLAIVLYAYNRHVVVVKRRQLQKLQQQVKVNKLEQMALRAQMNPHFLFNCINVIQQLVAAKDISNTNKFITSFSDLVRQTLDNAPELHITLNEEIKFLTNYFELERIRLEDRFSYRIDVTAVKDPHLWLVPNMVIQPFVENAIRHGILYKKNGRGFIEVRFEQRNDLLHCIITDNGIGREKAMQMRNESGVLHVSRGINITMKRVESLNTITKDMVSINIEDLKDENQQAAGTTVTIFFKKIAEPYDKDSYN